MAVPAATFLAVPESVTVRPKVTADALERIVRLGLPPLGGLGGGLAAIAGAAQRTTTSRTPPILFMSPGTPEETPSWAHRKRSRDHRGLTKRRQSSNSLRRDDLSAG